MNEPRPMTKEEADAAVANTLASIRRYGIYHKVCSNCGRTVGGRLAEYGEPTPEDLARAICPFCHDKGVSHTVAAVFEAFDD